MRRLILLLPLCFAVASLSGCGNKGPLVRAPASTPASGQSAPALPASSASSDLPSDDDLR